MQKLVICAIALAVCVFLLPSPSCASTVCDGIVRCPLDSEGGLNFLPHPTDCAKSYKCRNGKPMIFTCPEGEHFSVAEQKCVDASRVVCNRRCVDTQIIPGEVQDSEAQDSESSEGSSESQGCDISRCPATDGNKPIYLNHEDCSKFCVCDGFRVQVFECPAPLHFNPNLDVCDWPINVGCQNN